MAHQVTLNTNQRGGHKGKRITREDNNKKEIQGQTGKQLEIASKENLNLYFRK